MCVSNSNSQRFSDRTGIYVRSPIPNAAWAFANTRKFGFRRDSLFTSFQSCAGSACNLRKASGSSNCRKNALFLGVRSYLSGPGSLLAAFLSSAKNSGIDLDPFLRDADQSPRKIMVE